MISWNINQKYLVNLLFSDIFRFCPIGSIQNNTFLFVHIVNDKPQRQYFFHFSN